MKKSIPLITLALAIMLATTSYAYDKIHGDGHVVPKVNYDSIFEQATPLSESAEGQALVDDCIERYGGLEKLSRIKSMKLIYKMVMALTQDTSEIVKFYASDRKLKTIRTRGEHVKERTLNRNLAWLILDDSLSDIGEHRLKAELFSHLTLSLPAAMKNRPFAQVRFGRRADDSLLYIYMVKQDTLMIIAGIDPKELLIKSVEGIIYKAEGYSVYVNLFTDFREQHGYLFAHSLTNISLGLTVGQSILESVEINPTLAQDFFKPVKSGSLGESD